MAKNKKKKTTKINIQKIIVLILILAMVGSSILAIFA